MLWRAPNARAPARRDRTRGRRYARHFLTCCRRLLGLEWTHEANGINIHYGGRSVLVTCIHAGMDQEVIRSISEEPAVQTGIADLMRRSAKKFLVAGVDRMERLKGVPLKLLAFERFLEKHPDKAATVLLYEVSLAARERGADYENTKEQVSQLVQRINAKFSPAKDDPVVVWEERDEKFFQLKDRLALLSTADVFLDTTVRGGLNRWPLEFVLAQSYMGGQGSEYLPKEKTSGLMILSEFTSCMRVLQGALTVGTTDGSSMAVPLNVLGNCSRVDTSPTGEVRATLVWAMEDFHPPGSIDPVRSLVHNIDIDIMHAYCMRCHAYARDTMAGQSAEL